MAANPKVSAATVGAAFTTIVVGIVGPHVFPHGIAPDVQGLIAALVTAGVTFGSGWFARDVAPKVAPLVKTLDTVYTRIEQAPPPVAEVVKALEAEVAKAPSHVTLPVAQALPQA